VILRLFCAVLFSVIGTFCAWAVLNSFVGASSASNWVAVKADVLQAKLADGESRNPKRYRAKATYAYEFQGHKYEGNRIDLDPLAFGDNVGTWREDTGSQLIAAKSARRPINVWVDPASPSEALVDRDIHWGFIALFLPIAVVSFFAAYKCVAGKKS